MVKLCVLQPVFHNLLTGFDKEINCIRVDGATDEGPGHELVQYWWTEWHFWQKKVSKPTLVEWMVAHVVILLLVV